MEDQTPKNTAAERRRREAFIAQMEGRNRFADAPPKSGKKTLLIFVISLVLGGGGAYYGLQEGWIPKDFSMTSFLDRCEAGPALDHIDYVEEAMRQAAINQDQYTFFSLALANYRDFAEHAGSKVTSVALLHIASIEGSSCAKKALNKPNWALEPREQAQLSGTINRLKGIIAEARLNAINGDLFDTPKARDAVRERHLNVLLDAVHQYVIEHGEAPPGIPIDKPREICAQDARACKSLLPLAEPLKPYLVTIPQDPNLTGEARTGYSIIEISDGVFSAYAYQAEIKRPIIISR